MSNFSNELSDFELRHFSVPIPALFSITKNFSAVGKIRFSQALTNRSSLKEVLIDSEARCLFYEIAGFPKLHRETSIFGYFHFAIKLKMN